MIKTKQPEECAPRKTKQHFISLVDYSFWSFVIGLSIYFLLAARQPQRGEAHEHHWQLEETEVKSLKLRTDKKSRLSSIVRNVKHLCTATLCLDL